MFSASTDIKSLKYDATKDFPSNATEELRLLVQAFLEARNAVIPRQPLHRAQPVVQEESQEYGDAEFDFSDPDIVAMLQDADTAAAAERKSKEAETCKVIEDYVARWIFRLICAGLSSLLSKKPQIRLTMEEIDKWIECWIGSIEVLVRNGHRVSFHCCFGVH